VDARGDVEKVPNNNQNKKVAMSSAADGGVLRGGAVRVLPGVADPRVDGVDQVVTELGCG
jgi:uncharacterized protein YaaQ